ncbi:ACT domain protein [Roseivivax jejudonensis]|uniref:ACT domain protein n=1 Tax=Roseivivax jejudonensis TaxID=1529041 RepID=A0A1X6YG56_9RHOB|nr:ACT domain-containing protein [Roseivivax jejudonensis]SLN20478.1 ACT domain protein [Roseivivax jejudonensis]
MIRGMQPALGPGEWIFAGSDDPGLMAQALATFREDEGLSLILPLEVARAAGLDTALPMRRIVLQVNSALDGIGLTAAVSTALTEAGIACNVVAALCHDHVFVPAADAERAHAVLTDLADG